MKKVKYFGIWAAVMLMGSHFALLMFYFKASGFASDLLCHQNFLCQRLRRRHHRRQRRRRSRNCDWAEELNFFKRFLWPEEAIKKVATPTTGLRFWKKARLCFALITISSSSNFVLFGANDLKPAAFLHSFIAPVSFSFMLPLFLDLNSFVFSVKQQRQ